MKIPETDSIQALADYWDHHDLTDHDEDLEEVEARVFVRGSAHDLRVTLTPNEQAELRRRAQERGVDEATLIGEWVREKLAS
jgi:homoserine acetyltransferase